MHFHLLSQLHRSCVMKNKILALVEALTFLEFVHGRNTIVEILLKTKVLEFFICLQMIKNSPCTIKGFMGILVVLLHCILIHNHILKNSMNLMLNRIMVVIHLQMQADEKLMIIHDAWRFCLSFFM